MHYAITGGNVVSADEHTGAVREGCLKGTQHSQIVDLFRAAERGSSVSSIFCGLGGSDGDEAMQQLLTLLEEVTSETSKVSTVKEGTDRYVVLLADHKCGAAKVSVQLISSLNDETARKVYESKAELPSHTNEGAQVCNAPGSSFKTARSVYLGTADFCSRISTASIKIVKYE